jgi:GrpB-like predicted nucleotidyltransferase (UPF0157 family)
VSWRPAVLGPVLIVDYDPHWPDVFDEPRAPVVAALGDLVVSVEHVGSTAVSGLAAKPIIDMNVVVPSGADFPVDPSIEDGRSTS